LFEAIASGTFSVYQPDPTISTSVQIEEKESVLQLDERPVPNNLPIQTTPFIGRKVEIADLKRLLPNPEVRLVTVLSAGGMGKTWLAIKVGTVLLDQFPDGVFFVSLTRLESEILIVPSVIQALGIEFALEDTEAGDTKKKLTEHLMDNLRRKRLLLILDPFEHLLEGVSLVNEILQTAPVVTVMATSRARLNISGEQRFPILGMDVSIGVSISDTYKSDGLRLFLQSAQRARPSFEPQSDDLKYIVNICRFVEGMPLGIRLAAAWVEMLFPREIAHEISQSLNLLETDSRDVPAPQRSIRAMFDHSWNLLNPREREVFQCSVEDSGVKQPRKSLERRFVI
jgi:predicted ATPase